VKRLPPALATTATPRIIDLLGEGPGRLLELGFAGIHAAPLELAGWEVVVVEPTGADTQLFCRFNGQELTSLVRDRVNCRAGDKIGLMPDLARAHLFDTASGVRLVA